MEQKPPPITLNWIEEQEAFHKKKLSSLAALRAAYLDATGSFVPEPPPGKPLNINAAITKKRAIFKLLESGGVTPTSVIVETLIKQGFKDTTQQNTSPQLSLYRSQGFLDLHQNGWSITNKGRLYLTAAEAAEKN